jgi:hypothetical protein
MTRFVPPISQDGSILFEAGFMYPLKDPERYDDEEYGAGYAFAMIDADASPGTCWMHDAWIVNAKGEKHPGYEESPIPVRREDVDMMAGRPAPGSETRPIFDMHRQIGN